ncbi:SDR family oxidoreductase [Nocardioides sp.]|uniref:SDR family NAD(P)-dependent oxidoreductase n=1 Tax=Nocardioides sp. TaxID=35761 RepID=UPI001A35BF63|nr:SDR family oxidoreductase [Nocardioides sp.]MBJ7359142.1 SDR family oxidoreductase [Nocardioides sp.]
MKTALITGASAGIGQATALELARRDIGVIATYRTHQAEGEETVDRIQAAGGRAVALPLDLGGQAGLGDFVASVAGALDATWGTSRLDFLVNNAGAGGGDMFADITEDRFDLLQQVLFKGPYFLTQRLLPVLVDGGAIVNVGSTSALPGQVTAGYSAYAAPKAALHAVTPYWAKELAGRRIRVNAVAPGTTRTRLGGDVLLSSPELVESLGQGVAFGRIGEPEEVARVIAFLLSDEAAWVTGQVVEVSGGQGL